MSTSIRPEISKRSKYWIPKHRYYELKHFCLQYPSWKKKLESYRGPQGTPSGDIVTKTNDVSNPTLNEAVERQFYQNRVDMIENSAAETGEGICDYVLKAVIEGHSFETLKTLFRIPYSKETYYEAYRKFFYHLSIARA